MGLAQGVRGRGRHQIISTHRLQKYLEYFNRYLDGDPKVTAEMVAERGRKLKAIGGKNGTKR